MHVMVLQFFERPKQLAANEQPDDLLFFVINEAYQVRHLCHILAHIPRLSSAPLGDKRSNTSV
jgi:hypothetical protein